MGLFVGWAGWHIAHDLTLVAIGGAPGLIGFVMLVRTYFAKTLDELTRTDL
jgi:hypothetical protein